MSSNKQLMILKEKLSSNPYQLDLLVNKLLVASYISDDVEKNASIQALRVMLNEGSLTRILKNLEDMNAEVSYSDGVWFVMPNDGVYNNEFIKLCLLHKNKCASLKKRELNNLLLVEVAPVPQSFIDTSIEGIDQLVISGLEQSIEELSASIAHEMAHAFWPCKNRLLAEGIALFFECQQVPESSYIKNDDSISKYILDNKSELPSFTSLLTNPFKGSVFLTENSTSTNNQYLIYSCAFSIIKQFVEKHGYQSLEKLCESINSAEDIDAPFVFTNALGEVSWLEGMLDNRESIDINTDSIDQAIISDRAYNEAKSYDSYYLPLSSLSKLETSVELNVLLARILKLKTVQLLSSKHDASQVIEEMKVVKNRLESLGDDAYSAYFSAVIDSFLLQVTENAIEKAIINSRIRNNFKKALTLLPNFEEVFIDAAVCELYVPVMYGQKSNYAKELLNTAAKSPKYLPEVSKVEEYFNLQKVG